MLFYILMFIAAVAVPATSLIAWWADSKGGVPMPGLSLGMGAILGCFISFITSMFVLGTWFEHASDVSKVVAQEHRIEVQQERIESLTQRLDQFDYPEKPGISLDSDTPWASIVESLTDAENQLAKAKDERAIAIRSIEARKRGPMSGVVSFVGDYKQ